MTYPQAQEYHEATSVQEIRAVLAKCFPFPRLPQPSNNPRYFGSLDCVRRNCVVAEQMGAPWATFRAIVTGFASCDQVIDHDSICCRFSRTLTVYRN